MKSKIEEAHSHIAGTKVAQILIDFQVEFADVYPPDVFLGMCAVGPVQSMIGHAIKIGHLSEGATSQTMLLALKKCQKALAMVIEPNSIKQSTVIAAFAQAMEAEAAARAAIAIHSVTSC